MASIYVDDVTARDRTVEATIRTAGDVGRFIAEPNFHTTYDVSVEGVPEAICSIPVLAQICPVAWATGADVYVDRIDRTFAKALEDVQSSLCSMYDFIEGGTVYARETTDVRSTDDGQIGLLFTGGVDSTSSYVRLRDRDPLLITMRGWTITQRREDDPKWDAVRSHVSQFADHRGLETAFIESNLFDVLDHPLLLAHYKRYVDGAWYSSVGHGLGLLGLCAPLAHVNGLTDIFVAATHWEGIDLEWGSRPDVDNAVRWNGLACHHHGYEWTRQERIDAIADYVEACDIPLTLQTCNVQLAGNCGRCEKCYRTAIGLRLSGLDPHSHGYDFTADDYKTVRRSFERGEWVLGQDERYMWEDIRERVREIEPVTPREATFFDWLDSVDLDDLVDTATAPLHHRMLRAGLRQTPKRVYSTMYPVWRYTSDTYHRLRT